MKIRLERLNRGDISDPSRTDCSFEVTKSSYYMLPVLPITDFSKHMPHLTTFNELFPNHAHVKCSRHKAIAMLSDKDPQPACLDIRYNFDGLYFLYCEEIDKWVAFDYVNYTEEPEEMGNLALEVVIPWRGTIYRMNDAAMAIVQKYYCN